jgi:hypothetical protein
MYGAEFEYIVHGRENLDRVHRRHINQLAIEMHFQYIEDASLAIWTI